MTMFYFREVEFLNYAVLNEIIVWQKGKVSIVLTIEIDNNGKINTINIMQWKIALYHFGDHFKLDYSQQKDVHPGESSLA